MSINPISSMDVYATSSTFSSPKPTASSQDAPQDTVKLSPQALASLDKDHDGDSH